MTSITTSLNFNGPFNISISIGPQFNLERLIDLVNHASPPVNLSQILLQAGLDIIVLLVLSGRPPDVSHFPFTHYVPPDGDKASHKDNNEGNEKGNDEAKEKEKKKKKKKKPDARLHIMTLPKGEMEKANVKLDASKLHFKTETKSGSRVFFYVSYTGK